jgi:hypothetical protein
LSTDHSRPSPNNFWSTVKPNWDSWNRLTRCQLWQAAALACDIDPNIFKANSFMTKAHEDKPLSPVPDSVHLLLDLAKSAVGGAVLKVSRARDVNLIQGEVDLSEFSAWLREIGHQTPIEFPWTPPKLGSGPYRWPWGDYETKDLRLLAQAADKFWKNYDPNDHSTAPTNEKVIEWLMKKKMPKRTAQVVATLLRADDLPVGRRSSN